MMHIEIPASFERMLSTGIKVFTICVFKPKQSYKAVHHGVFR